MIRSVVGIGRRWDTCRAAVRDNLRARSFWAATPRNTFCDEGHEVIEGFLDPAECARLVTLADEHLPGPSHRVSGDCYTWVKSESSHGRNSRVRELLNVEHIDDGVTDLMRRRVIQGLFEERLGERVELYGLSIQHDDVDTSTKRGFHVDCLYPPQFKAFVYLTDVEDEGDGPYTIVAGSHRNVGRKLSNDVTNAVTSGARRDMRYLVPRNGVRSILGPAGTLILSTQDAMHKGGSNHWRRPRYALIAYGTPARFFEGGPLTEGIEFLDAATTR